MQQIQEDFSMQRIIENCRKKYVSILPHTITKKPEPQKVRNQKASSKKQFSKLQISQMIVQLNSIIQLLAQNYVLAQDKELKTKCYRLIKEFRTRMLADLDHYDTVLIKKSNNRLIRHSINFSQIAGHHRSSILVEISPQISIFQDPLLCYMFQTNVHAQIFKNQVYDNAYKAISIIEKHVPIFNKMLLPHFEQQSQNRAKFSILDDRILLNAMINFGFKNSRMIRALFFKNKDDDQVRNRIKNLLAKASDHPIRVWRMSQQTELTESEIKRLVKIFEETGPRWKVISRYYDMKNSNYFESRYDQNLQIDSNQQALNANPFMLRFRQLQQDRKIFHQPEQLFIVNGRHFDNISDNGDEWDINDMMDMHMGLNMERNNQINNNNTNNVHKSFDFNNNLNNNGNASRDKESKKDKSHEKLLQIPSKEELIEELKLSPQMQQFFNIKSIQKHKQNDKQEQILYEDNVQQQDDREIEEDQPRRRTKKIKKNKQSKQKKRIERHELEDMNQQRMIAMQLKAQLLATKRQAIEQKEFVIHNKVTIENEPELDIHIRLQKVIARRLLKNKKYGFIRNELFKFQNL